MGLPVNTKKVNKLVYKNLKQAGVVDIVIQCSISLPFRMYKNFRILTRIGTLVDQLNKLEKYTILNHSKTTKIVISLLSKVEKLRCQPSVYNYQLECAFFSFMLHPVMSHPMMSLPTALYWIHAGAVVSYA